MELQIIVDIINPLETTANELNELASISENATKDKQEHTYNIQEVFSLYTFTLYF